jgi:deoxycytidylate deaminase
LRCRRILINAGIEKAVIRKEEGGIKSINSQYWAREDTKTYSEKIERTKKEKKPKL